MGCTRSPFSGGLQCCAFCTGPVNPDVIWLESENTTHLSVFNPFDPNCDVPGRTGDTILATTR